MKALLQQGFAAAVSALALTLPAGKVQAGNFTGHASAAIDVFITVTETTSMTFASIVPAAAGGNVVLTTTGTITPPGGFSVFGTPAAGVFNAKSFAGFPAAVTFSTGDTVSDGAGHSMALGTYTNNAAGSFNASGNLPFNVGATLTVGANQASGSYIGTYTVTVNF